MQGRVGIYALVARGGSNEGEAGDLCRAVLLMGWAAALLLAACFFVDGADPSMPADFSEPRAASAGSFCVT